MIFHARWHFSLVLVGLGIGWGLTHPLTKIAATGGLAPLGMVFWQLIVGALALGLVLRRKLGRLPLSSTKHLAFWLMIALIGTIIPNWVGFIAIRHLPAGVISVSMSFVPMMAFPIALALGIEAFATRRLLGLSFGFMGVLLIALPDASLPEQAGLMFLPLALVAPLCYAFEGNIIARWGTHGLDPLEVLFGASCIGAAIALPLAIGAGHFFWPSPGSGPVQALMASSVIHVVVYTTYVWLVGRAGPIFAGQVSYVVTAAGVLLAVVLLGESFGAWFWVALVLILGGVALVQPRRDLAEPDTLGNTADSVMTEGR